MLSGRIRRFCLWQTDHRAPGRSGVSWTRLKVEQKFWPGNGTRTALNSFQSNHKRKQTVWSHLGVPRRPEALLRQEPMETEVG
jgi:hypothetical protein